MRLRPPDRSVWVRLWDAVERLAQAPAWSGAVALFVLSVGAAGPLLVSLAVTMEPDRFETTDLRYFADRASTILEGGDLYGGDTEYPALTPPLVNVLLIIPYVAGHGVMHYALFFVVFSYLTGLALFLGLRRLNARWAFWAGAFYVTSPFSYITATVMAQDETIIPFFVALAYVSVLVWGVTRAAGWVGLGTMVKAFPAVTAPVLFFAAHNAATKARVALWGFATAFLVTVPFLLAGPRGLLTFLRFYATGDAPEDGPFDGHSLLKFLTEVGLGWPTIYSVAALLAASAALWWALHRRRVSAVQGVPIAFLLFFIFYPKIHYGYYLCLLVVLLPWAVGSWQRVAGLLAAAGFARGAHLAWHGDLPGAGGLVVPIVLNLALILYWAWWIRVVLRDRDPFTSSTEATTTNGEAAGPDDATVRKTSIKRAHAKPLLAVLAVSLLYAWGLAIYRLM